jgi:hypothetical protein
MRVAVMACEPYSVCQQQHIIMGLPIGQNERRFSCRDEQMQNIFRLKTAQAPMMAATRLLCNR